MCARRVSSLSRALYCVPLLIATAASAQVRIFSDHELLKVGNDAYGSRDCATATRFLFAYRQRNPAEYQTSPALQQNVAKALDACYPHVSRATAGTDAKTDLPDSKATGAPTFTLPPVQLQAPTGAGASNGRCDIYASIAVAQQRANLAQGCNFQGSPWQMEYRHHYDWCVQVPSANSRAGTAERQRLLEQCRP